MFNDIASLEKKLKLQDGFYTKLLENDDWSFLIKLSALFEAACTHALTQRLSCPELLYSLSHLEFADNKKGKVKFLQTLGAVTAQQAKILFELAELRNRLVHNIEQVNFSITKYFNDFDNNQLKAKSLLWGHAFGETVTDNGKKISRAEFVRRCPKFALWMTCAEILACLYLEFELAEIRAENNLAYSSADTAALDVGGLLSAYLVSPDNPKSSI